MKQILETASLDDAERLYIQGRVTREELTEYLRAWNAGPHVTQAVLSDGRIRNFDPETVGVFYRHLAEEFGVHGIPALAQDTYAPPSNVAQRFDVVEEIGDSRPREWRILDADVDAGHAIQTLRSLRNMSPSARFARGRDDFDLYTSEDLLSALAQDTAK